MLTWIDESNKYEIIQKAYFGNYEITVIGFSSGGFCAWVKPLGKYTQPTLFKKSYKEEGYTFEKVKETFLKEFREYLEDRYSYWWSIYHDFWVVEQWIDEENEDG